MGDKRTSEVAAAPFVLEQELVVGHDPRPPVQPVKSKHAMRKLGMVVISGRPVSVWSTDGMIYFRSKRKRHVDSISLISVYHRAAGQKEFSL